MAVKVKPAEGLRVLDPKSKKPIPAEGIELPEVTTYWHRRIEAGDVVVVEEPAAPVQVAKRAKVSETQAGGDSK